MCLKGVPILLKESLKMTFRTLNAAYRQSLATVNPHLRLSQLEAIF